MKMHSLPLAFSFILACDNPSEPASECPQNRDAADCATLPRAGDSGTEDPGPDLAEVDASSPGAAPSPIVPTCYLDRDGDGYGAGLAPCSSDTAKSSKLGGDCNDNDAAVHPDATDPCDGVDNDCSGAADDNGDNGCGGSCPLGAAPGDPCSNGLLGTCHAGGIMTCSSARTIACSAPAIQPTTEMCGDDLDNDCDGLVDESDAADAKRWYPDNDGDGYAPPDAPHVDSCTEPDDRGRWTTKAPQAFAIDCNDSSWMTYPGAIYWSNFLNYPVNGNTSLDFNCSGSITPDPDQPKDTCALAVITTLRNMGITQSNAHQTLQTCPGGQPPSQCTLWFEGETPTIRPTKKCPDTPYWLKSVNGTPCDIGRYASQYIAWGCR